MLCKRRDVELVYMDATRPPLPHKYSLTSCARRPTGAGEDHLLGRVSRMRVFETAPTDYIASRSSGFVEDASFIQCMQESQPQNVDGAGTLLLGFFGYYASRFDYGQQSLCLGIAGGVLRHELVGERLVVYVRWSVNWLCMGTELSHRIRWTCRSLQREP